MTQYHEITTALISIATGSLAALALGLLCNKSKYWHAPTLPITIQNLKCTQRKLSIQLCLTTKMQNKIVLY